MWGRILERTDSTLSAIVYAVHGVVLFKLVAVRAREEAVKRL